MKIIDISQEILSCRVYDGDPAPSGERIKSMDNGEVYNLSVFSMCAHNGTHIDAPLHFINDGGAIDSMAMESFVGDCFVAVHNGEVSGDDAHKILEKARELGADKRILIGGEAVVSEEAALVFASAEILLLGNESQSVGPINAPMKVHKILLSKGIALLEGIVLEGVCEGKYLLNCAPLNLAGFDGSPCRAILIEES